MLRLILIFSIFFITNCSFDNKTGIWKDASETIIEPNKDISDLNENKEIFTPILVKYCTAIIMKYTNFKTRKFDDQKYFTEVFSKNCDIWGIFTSYFDTVLLTDNFFNDLKSKQIKYIKKNIANLFLKYCLSTNYATKPYNIYELKYDLNNLLPR